ncbi:MAG: flagellar protein FlaG [Candidatus Hydrogenedentota bacterium]
MDIQDVTSRRVVLEPSIMRHAQKDNVEPGRVESAELPIKGSLLEELQKTPGFTPKDLLKEKAMMVGETVNLLNRGLDYWVDEDTDKIVMQIVNRHTQEVIRQIPPEEIIEISGRLQQLVGLIFDRET